MEQERKMFEAWVKLKYAHSKKMLQGGQYGMDFIYVDHDTQRMWLSWTERAKIEARRSMADLVTASPCRLYP